MQSTIVDISNQVRRRVARHREIDQEYASGKRKTYGLSTPPAADEQFLRTQYIASDDVGYPPPDLGSRLTLRRVIGFMEYCRIDNPLRFQILDGIARGLNRASISRIAGKSVRTLSRLNAEALKALTTFVASQHAADAKIAGLEAALSPDEARLREIKYFDGVPVDPERIDDDRRLIMGNEDEPSREIKSASGHDLPPSELRARFDVHLERDRTRKSRLASRKLAMESHGDVDADREAAP